MQAISWLAGILAVVMTALVSGAAFFFMLHEEDAGGSPFTATGRFLQFAIAEVAFCLTVAGLVVLAITNRPRLSSGLTLAGVLVALAWYPATLLLEA